MPATVPSPPGPPPSETTLREAALAHLARYATTRAGLLRVLDRRIARWARTADPDTAASGTEAARQAARAVVARLAEAGAVDDAAFAAARGRSLVRAGRSRRAAVAHLAARGVATFDIAAALPEDAEAELAAALALARRRRLGPFRRDGAAPGALMHELGVLARAGFSQDIARRALAMDGAAAEDLVNRLHRS
jgi:regulatory protein